MTIEQEAMLVGWVALVGFLGLVALAMGTAAVMGVWFLHRAGSDRD
jgi:hypothetical protein